MSTANQHPRTSVQRLRVAESAISTLGSQLPDPRTLRPGRPSGLNMPHPTRPGVRGTPSGFAAPAMGQRAAVKRWHTAQIAALPDTCEASVSRGPGQRRGRPQALYVFSRASSHHTTTAFFRRPLRADVMAGAVPPFFLSSRTMRIPHASRSTHPPDMTQIAATRQKNSSDGAGGCA